MPVCPLQLLCTSVSIADIPKKFDTSHIHLLSVELSGIAYKYSTLGIHLGIGPSEIRRIEVLSAGPRITLAKMLIEWRKEGRPLTDVIMAIRNPVLNNPMLAHELEQRWRKEGYSELVMLLSYYMCRFHLCFSIWTLIYTHYKSQEYV